MKNIKTEEKEEEKNDSWSEGMTQAVELLPSNHKALTSNPSTKKRRK
jgi:hypothetical protein